MTAVAASISSGSVGDQRRAVLGVVAAGSIAQRPSLAAAVADQLAHLERDQCGERPRCARAAARRPGGRPRRARRPAAAPGSERGVGRADARRPLARSSEAELLHHLAGVRVDGRVARCGGGALGLSHRCGVALLGPHRGDVDPQRDLLADQQPAAGKRLLPGEPKSVRSIEPRTAMPTRSLPQGSTAAPSTLASTWYLPGDALDRQIAGDPVGPGPRRARSPSTRT